MPRTENPNCVRCGIGLSGAFDAMLTCSRCRRSPNEFDAACSPWAYAGLAAKMLRLFKYHGRRKIGHFLARKMAACCTDRLPLDRIDLVAPVPLYWLKRLLKGFDPTSQLAFSVAQGLNKSYEPSLIFRRRWTMSQTALTSNDRWRNVCDAFIVRPGSLHNRGILLVDDILTSGATAQSCSRALRDAGAGCVFVLTAARTPLL